MKIYLASYQTLMINRGGPTYKILSLKQALDKLKINVEFFNMWDYDLKFDDDDIVHIFNANIHTYPMAMNLKLYGAKYVVNPIFFSNHSAQMIHMYRMLEAPFKKIFKRTYSDYYFTKFICDNAEQVLPNTRDEGNLLCGGLGVKSEKIEVIHNGVEERFAHADPALFEKKYDLKDFILYVGHLGAVRKNGPKIIEALQRIDHPAVLIADVLKNKEGDLCKEMLGKSKNILHIDWLKHDDPLFESAYAACHTFVLPTRYETPGRAALEAGLAGANVVITPYGGTREYFDSLAEYAEPSSVMSIIKMTELALNKKKSSDLRNHILKNFLWDKIAEQTVNMYKNVLSK
ncbi:MAG: glycosyltransferase family 4 protein [Candidatus Cloacimonetes bacterium]|nr:glycosyltransferase family 4 protein [Candidatus Cloacimonadota bacterium]